MGALALARAQPFAAGGRDQKSTAGFRVAGAIRTFGADRFSQGVVETTLEKLLTPQLPFAFTA